MTKQASNSTLLIAAIECHIPASLDAVVFMACMHQQENITILPSLSVYYSIDEDVEWKVDPFTLFQIDVSICHLLISARCKCALNNLNTLRVEGLLVY